LEYKFFAWFFSTYSHACIKLICKHIHVLPSFQSMQRWLSSMWNEKDPILYKITLTIFFFFSSENSSRIFSLLSSPIHLSYFVSNSITIVHKNSEFVYAGLFIMQSHVSFHGQILIKSTIQSRTLKPLLHNLVPCRWGKRSVIVDCL